MVSFDTHGFHTDSTERKIEKNKNGRREREGMKRKRGKKGREREERKRKRGKKGRE